MASVGYNQTKFRIALQVLGRLSVAERLLLSLSYRPDAVDKTSSHMKPTDEWNLENALETFTSAFPDFEARVRGKRVLDYGCGDGFQSIAIANLGADYALGVDINENRLAHARRLANGLENVGFSRKIDGEFDIVVSLNALEHFVNPLENIKEMKNALNDNGTILLSFGPPWFAPYGHHMYFFCPFPWINLLFSEATVMRVRSLYRSDGATSYEPGLNRMSIRKFERLIHEAGLTFEKRKYHSVKTISILAKIPLLRELFINQVDAVLRSESSLAAEIRPHSLELHRSGGCPARC